MGAEAVSGALIYGKNACLEYLRAQHAAPGQRKNPAQNGAERRGTERRGAAQSGALCLARKPGCPYAAEADRLARSLGFACLACSRRELSQKYPGVEHQGFVLELYAEALPRQAAGAAAARRLSPSADEYGREYAWREELQAALMRGEKPKVLILDCVQDPGNLGAIVRSAAQFGIACIFVPRDKACAFTAAARKSASGGENHVPIVQAVNLARLLDELKAMGFWSAAACREGGSSLQEFDFNFPYAVIVGSEGAGIRRLLLEKADSAVYIPTTGCLDSLNVSVAAGIIMYAMYTSSPSSERSR